MAKQQYPSYTQPRNPFGSLTHNAYVPTYVGLPIDRMKETADVLQNKYNTAISNVNTTETMLAQMKLNGADESKRTEALAGFQQELESYKIAGNYEDANTAVSIAAKNIATNSGLLLSLESEKGRLAQLTLNKQGLLSGKYDEKDTVYAEGESDAIYNEQGGVYFDEKTGSWKGKWEQIHIPERQNIGEIANKFLTGWKANKKIGKYVKAEVAALDANGKEIIGEDGRPVMVQKWFNEKDAFKDALGRFVVHASTEEATMEDVMFAAQKHLMQNPSLSARLAFEMKRDDISIETKTEETGESREDRVKAMKHQLKTLGYEENILNQLDDNELALLHEKNKRIQEGIIGASEKASFEKTTAVNWGDTLESLEEKARQKKAAEGGGDENTVAVNQEYLQMNSQAYQIEGYLPPSESEYKSQLHDMKQDEKVRNATITDLKAEQQQWIKEQKALGVDNPELPPVQKTKLAKMLTAQATQTNKIKRFETNYNMAIAEVKKENPGIGTPKDVKRLRKKHRETIPKDQLTEYDNNVKYYEEIKAFGVDDYKLQQMANTGMKPYTYNQYSIGKQLAKEMGWKFTKEDGVSWKEQAIVYNSPEYKKRRKEINDLYNKFYTSKGGLWDMGSRTRYQEVGEYHNIEAKSVGDYNRAVSKKLSDINKSNTIQYAYLNLSIEKNAAGSDLTSNFTTAANNLLRTDPYSFIHIGEDGQEEILENNATPKYNVNNITMLGPTTDYVHGHGVLFYGSEQILNDKGKATGEVKMHLFKDNTGSLKTLAMNQMERGRLIKGSEIKGEKGYNAMDDVLYKYKFEEVDKQIAYFQQLPIRIPALNSPEMYNTDDVKVALGPNKFANVTRRVDKSGTTDYQVTYGKKVGQTGANKIAEYSTVSNLEKALEYYGGVGANSEVYKVDMSTLDKVTEADLPYTTFKKDGKGLMSSMPRLKKEFKDNFIEVMNKAQIPITITSLTRSIGYNSSKAIGGAKNSGHLIGEGIDISVKDEGGKKFWQWLKDNSEDVIKADKTKSVYKRIKGKDGLLYNIIWQAHDVKTGMHLDLKYSKI